jgi:hypothetical protein
MDLKTYFQQHDGRLRRDGVELQRIAVETGVKPYYLFMVAAGHKTASALLARRVSAATGHAVAPSDLRADVFGPAPSKQEAA